MLVNQRLAFVLILLFMSGCASLGQRADQVKVTIADLQMLDSTLMEQRFLVTLRLQNRNKGELQIEGMSFDVELNGKDFASGVSNQPVKVPGFAEATLDVTVTSTIFGLLRQLQSMQELETESFRYKISGHLSTAGSLFSLPFSEQGEIDLRAPAINP